MEPTGLFIPNADPRTVCAAIVNRIRQHSVCERSETSTTLLAHPLAGDSETFDCRLDHSIRASDLCKCLADSLGALIIA